MFNINWNQPWSQQQNFGYSTGMQFNSQSFQLIRQGPGIDNTEFQTIVSSAQRALYDKMSPLSTGVANMIKNKIGGEWFVFIAPIGENNYDFSLSIITSSDFLSFKYGGFHFQVFRLKD